jgi:uncharacterized delta-60 repeat protein
VFGVARFNSDGTPDLTFDEDGKTLYEFSVGPTHWGTAVVVQPDRKIVLGGHVDANFALVRLTEAGLVDYGFGTQGQTVTDMGGSEYLYALLLTPGGWFVAAGGRVSGNNSDFVLAQYDPNGLPPMPGPKQPWAQASIDWTADDSAFAVDWRSDGQIVAAGCAGGKLAWAQLPSNAALYTPIKTATAFAGSGACATSVKFAGANKLIAAGYLTVSGDSSYALARYVTKEEEGGSSAHNRFLPVIHR